MFVVILAQSAATSIAYATRYGERFSENTDLVGLALANIGAGLSGTFVVNGSPTKTQIVDTAGGRSQLSLLVMAGIVRLVLLFLTGPLAFMPESALSAIVFLIGVGLIDVAGMQKIFTERRSEFWVALITASTVVIVGVEEGILLAIALSLIDHTRHGYRPKNAVLVPGVAGREPHPVATAAQAAPGLVIYRFTHSLYYANCHQLAAEISFLANTVRRPCAGSASTRPRSTTWITRRPKPLRSVHAMLKAKGIRLIVGEVMQDLKAKTRYQLTGAAWCGRSLRPGLEDVVKQYRQFNVAAPVEVVTPDSVSRGENVSGVK